MTAEGRGLGPASGPNGVVARVFAAWRDPGGSFEAERPRGEPRLLAYAFGASVFLTLGRMAAEVVRPDRFAAAAAEGVEPIGWIAVQVFAGLSFTPLALYGAAALIGLIAKLCGGTSASGSLWSDMRLAFFWSGFCAGPLGVAAQVAGAAVVGAAVGGAVAGAVWLALLAPMIARAGGFALGRTALVILAFAIAAFALRASA